MTWIIANILLMRSYPHRMKLSLSLCLHWCLKFWPLASNHEYQTSGSSLLKPCYVKVVPRSAKGSGAFCRHIFKDFQRIDFFYNKSNVLSYIINRSNIIKKNNKKKKKKFLSRTLVIQLSENPLGRRVHALILAKVCYFSFALLFANYYDFHILLLTVCWTPENDNYS